MALYYDNDPDWPVEIYDEVSILAAGHRFPAVVRKIHERTRKLSVSFESIDPVLDLIMLRKRAVVPFEAVELDRRGF